MQKNIITLKIKYSTENSQYILDCMKDYTKILKFTYNRILDNKMLDKEDLTTKQITELQNQMNNSFLDSHFKNSARIEACGLNMENKVCFGSKYYTQYVKGNITKEELDIKRLVPIYSVGESVHNSNRKFRILNNRQIMFQPDRKHHIILNLENYKNYKKHLTKLLELQKLKKIPITYKLDLDYVYLSFDFNSIIEMEKYLPIKNRIFAIDMNPNYIGYSVVDWKDEMSFKIIDSGVISIKDINDFENSLKGKHIPSSSSIRKRLYNKRNYEAVKTAQRLVKLAKHYKCECFALEGLDIESRDCCKGKRLNRLINNQWNRNRLINSLSKHSKANGITFIEVKANYSSCFGNLIFQSTKLPDMCLASLEISRRGYEFNLQHILKIKENKKNIVFPELQFVKDRVAHALEVLGYSEKFEDLKELYYSLKNKKLKYRVSLENCEISEVFSMLSTKSRLNLYKFNFIST